MNLLVTVVIPLVACWHSAILARTVYTTYEYAFEWIYYSNGVIWIPKGPSGHIQCANACSNSGVDLCTAYALTNDSKCVFYGGWLDYPGTTKLGGVYVNRLVKYKKVTDDAAGQVYSRQEVQQSDADAKCSAIGGYLTGPTRAQLKKVPINSWKYLGGEVEYWIRVRQGTNTSSGFYWVKDGTNIERALWGSGEPATLTGNQEACVYQSEGKLKVAPCSSNHSYVCYGLPARTF